MTNTNQPLYKQLNKQRTQGEWEFFKLNSSIFLKESETGGIAKVLLNNSISDETIEANAQYIALAVNNLHHLAEALENLINKASETTKDIVAFEGAYILDKAIDKAKEALNRIS